MRGSGSEWKLAEKPTMQCLQSIGYEFIDPSQHSLLRDGENQTIFRPHLVQALMRLNGISQADAEAAAAELIRKEDNEDWLKIKRGSFSRNVEGQSTQKTLHVIDFLNPSKNHFAVTHQLYVQAEKSRIPDVVVYVNGLPLVVIEAKSPLSGKDKNGEAFDQIKQYERDIPRLFYTNAFNIVTDGTTVLYGATHSPSKFYGYWRDPYPRKASDLRNELEKGLWSLLEPSRLLDLIAHFIVFERNAETGQTIKKICRYQQFRAVNRMVSRVVEGKHSRGLIWHTQGSGKSLTMVFAALKLKHHYTVESDRLAYVNLLVLTDRVDLDDQISSTFVATGLPNPTRIESVMDLRKKMGSGVDGQTLLSTIFKFEGSKTAIPNSHRWIVMVDECHRTQEKDLGAALRATLPDAIFFGFTGTPIKKNDKDTYQNFGVIGEGYLDKYGIDDAVIDGATVPIYYTSRKTDWQIDEAKIDSLFDTWFADLSDEKLAEIKERGVKVADLVKHPKRIELLAFDIWNHFKSYAKPDGFKAQLVAYDREAIVLYKRALDGVIADELVRGGMSREAAVEAATAMSACVYSQSQEDDKPSEDPYKNAVRKDLMKWYVDRDAERDIKKAFNKRGEDPQILIVCDKLLTGFDAPAEAVMYLDKPLKEHTLLQAIARTNRVADAKKKNGLIVDYIGVSQKLDEALESYRAEDVQNAMRDLDGLRAEMAAAHRALLEYTKTIRRNGKDLKAEYDALVGIIGTEDEWILFQRKVRNFITLYEALAPDPSILAVTDDLKWFANFLRYGKQVFEKKEALDQGEYSAKIREMLEEHLKVMGLTTVIKLRSVVDPDFWQEFETEGKEESDLKSAALRKTTELRKITEAKLAENHHQYAKFSEKLRELIEKMDDTQLSWGDKLKAAQDFAKDIEAEAEAHKETGLSPAAHAILRVIQDVEAADEAIEKQLATIVEKIYTDPDLAPRGFQNKDGVKKDLRQRVRKEAHILGFRRLKDLPIEIEEIAIKFYAKSAFDD
jgi:type I restriction enzyme, R subunit